MAARRAARAATRAAARRSGAPECLGRRVLGPASRADEDVTELDSITAGRIDQAGPHCITDFRPAAFRQRQPPCATGPPRLAELPGPAPGYARAATPEPGFITGSFRHASTTTSLTSTSN